MTRFPLLLASCLLANGAASALQVDFTVMDKLGKPVDGASICLQADAGQCAQTNSQGKSSFAPTVGLGGAVPATGAGKAGPVLRMRAGSLFIDAPEAGMARLARFDQGGRRMGDWRKLNLEAGANRVEGLEPVGAGISFFVLETADMRVAVPAVALPGIGFGNHGAAWEPARGSRPTALGKAATANLHAIVISKSGFQTVTYRPQGESETVQIRMSVTGDSAIRYTGIIRAKVTGFDTASHTLGYAYNENKCTGPTPSSSEQTASLPLWIKDGKWYFPAGNCQAVVLAKPGVGIYGQWKTVGVENMPAGLFPIACDPVKDSLVTAVVNLFFLSEGGGWDIDLLPDSITVRINRMVCPGNQLVQNPSAFDGQAGRPLLTGNSCRQVDFRNAKDEAARYAFTLASDSLRAVYTYGAKTCTSNGVSLSLETTAPKTCPETAPTSVMADTVWQGCVKGSGFVQ